MAEKKTYWIRNLFGHKALVAGADERDRWVPHGWAESDEPTDGEFVYMEHPDEGIAGRPLIPWGARDYWQAVGFAPSPPEEPFNPTKDPALRDVPRQPDKTEKPAASRSNQSKE